jgi:hypothetical protein
MVPYHQSSFNACEKETTEDLGKDSSEGEVEVKDQAAMYWGEGVGWSMREGGAVWVRSKDGREKEVVGGLEEVGESLRVS